MSTTTITPQPRVVTAKAVALAAVFAVGMYFISKFVFYYYLHYSPAGFGNRWAQRLTLLLHITCGMLALAIGPFQFSQRLRRRSLSLHRLLGRVYLISIALGSLASFRLAVTTTEGFAWGFGLAMLGVAWITTSGMAYYAVMRRQIQIHKEWMVRSYVVTFAFVTFRFLSLTAGMAHLMPPNQRAISAIWFCWAVPLLFTEVILQLRRMPAPAR